MPVKRTDYSVCRQYSISKGDGGEERQQQTFTWNGTKNWLTGHQSVQYLNSRLSFARKESSTSGQWRILSIDRLQILFNEVHPVCPVQFTIQIRMILQRRGVKRRSMQNNWITNLFTPAKYRKVVWRWDKSDLGNLRRDRGRWWRFRSIRRSPRNAGDLCQKVERVRRVVGRNSGTSRTGDQL